MLGNLISALEITLIGMGLVFSAIILLWGVMVVLSRAFEEHQLPSKQPSPEEQVRKITADSVVILKRRAAVTAVACALSQSRNVPREFPLPPTAIVSAWQAVARSNMLTNMLKRGRVR